MSYLSSIRVFTIVAYILLAACGAESPQPTRPQKDPEAEAPQAFHDVSVDFEGADQMMRVFDALARNSENVQAEIDRLFALDAYMLAFFPHHNRIAGTLSPDTYRKLLLALPTGLLPPLTELTATTQHVADEMFSLLHVAFVNGAGLRKTVEYLKTQRSQEEAVKLASDWLPKGHPIKTRFFFLMDGLSSGFAINGVVAQDVLQIEIGPGGLPRDFIATMAHELHHQGSSTLLESFHQKTETDFYKIFATAYVAMALSEGVPSRFINEMPQSLEGEAKTEWDAYESSSLEIFAKYESEIQSLLARNGNLEEMEQYFYDYWLGGVHGRIYFVGVKMIDIVHRYRGRDAVINVLQNGHEFLRRYNEAAQVLSDQGEALYLFKEKTVNQIVAFGQSSNIGR